MDSLDFSPKQFLKARRPERFSDSVAREETELDRSLLEFHLSEITAHSQEADFERFARRLCELEICPNLLPHTGPTGGGDSGVDSETYPVADQLALAWYVGVGREAAEERWAFAFSAKADWRSKVASDIAKLSDRGRAYAKAFFVTNQPVSDKKRADVEDKLSRQHAIDVRILDRSWILDRIYTGHHEPTVAETLGITGLSRSTPSKGPLDTERESALKDVEERIRAALAATAFGPALVANALEAGELARSLERPREEVLGRFVRADDLAMKYGTERQRIESAYQWAWTLFWWYEDVEAFNEMYAVVEERARSTRNVYDLECLLNLWHILHGLVGRSVLEPEPADYAGRTSRLSAELDRLRTEKDRPSTSLQAETLLLHLGLAQRAARNEPFDEELTALSDVVRRSSGLVGYPFEPLVDILIELAPALETSAAYEPLFETIVDVAGQREGDVKAARLLLQRGEGQLQQDKPHDAIVTLGRCLGPLYKEETRHDLVRALYLLGCAYDTFGLPWAARGTLLSAASVAANDWWRLGEVTPYQAACYRRLKWLELRLGRLAHVLAWHEVDAIVRREMAERGYDRTKLFEADQDFEMLLGSLLIRVDPFDLRTVSALPDTLDALGLESSAEALLYVLGYDDRLAATAAALGKDTDELASTWARLASVPALPAQPDLCNRQKIRLSSRVLGISVTAEVDNASPCVELAESLLAALEAFLATSAIDRAMAAEPEVTIVVRVSDFTTFPFDINRDESAARPLIELRCPVFDPHQMSTDAHQSLRNRLLEAVATVVGEAAIFRDPTEGLEVLFRDERVSDRAINFTSSFATIANVLGNAPRTSMDTWSKEASRSYAPRRRRPLQLSPSTPNAEESPSQPGDGEAPEELRDPNARPHSDMETVSPIRQRLWDRAGWAGTGFVVDASHQDPPVMALIFRDREAGAQIFQGWRRDLGGVDEHGAIRVAILRGIDAAQPQAYAVIIGPNPANIQSKRFITLISRVKRMTPTSALNLDRFLAAEQAVGAFLLAPAYAIEKVDGARPAEFDMALGVLTRELHVRQTWEVGSNDLEAVAVREDSNPLIPAGVEDAPVLSVLRRARGERAQS